MKLGDLFICVGGNATGMLIPAGNVPEFISNANEDNWDTKHGHYGIVIDPKPVKYCDHQIILVLIDGVIGHIAKGLIRILP